jgi:hypothetical protein
MKQQDQTSIEGGYAIAYTHIASIGDWMACSEFMDEATVAVGALYANASLEGYQVFMVEDADTALDEQVTGETLEQVTEGRFPFVYVRLQPVSQIGLNLDDFMSNLGCIRVD